MTLLGGVVSLEVSKAQARPSRTFSVMGGVPVDASIATHVDNEPKERRRRWRSVCVLKVLAPQA